MKTKIAFVIAIFGLSITPALAQTNSLQDIAKELIQSPSDSTTIYISREFITIDPTKPRANALSVKNGRFTAVGSLAEVQAVVGKDANLTVLDQGPYEVSPENAKGNHSLGDDARGSYPASGYVQASHECFDISSECTEFR